MRVVFVLFLLLLSIGLGIRRQKRDLLSVGCPDEITDASLAFGQSRSLAAVDAHHVDLLLLVAIRKKSELFSVRRPARRRFLLRRVGELTSGVRRFLIQPDMARTAFAFRRLGDNECDPQS